jgi:hypothetical protein
MNKMFKVISILNELLPIILYILKDIKQPTRVDVLNAAKAAVDNHVDQHGDSHVAMSHLTQEYL